MYEADYNMLNRKVGKDVMATAEKIKLIAPEQYGSRRQLSATLHCFNKVLTFDIIRQMKRNAAVCSNDAKGCYDRIAHNV